MITRIVKLEFQTESIDAFVEIFHANKEKILLFDGCHEVTLLQDVNDPRIFFTHSKWDNEAALNAYRSSSFFGEVWPRTKRLLKSQPIAWSTKVSE